MRNDNGMIIVGAVVAVLLDVVLSPNLPLFSNTPNFMIAYSMVVAIISKGTIAYGIAFALGLVSDLLGYGPVGSLSILLMIAVAVSRSYLNDFSRSKGIAGIVALLCIILGVEVIHGLGTVLFIPDVDPIDAVVYIALPCSILDCALGVVIYTVMSRLLLPKTTSFGQKPPRLRRF